MIIYTDTQTKTEQCAEEIKPCPFCYGLYIFDHPKMRNQPPFTSKPKLEELTEGGWRVTCYGCGIGIWDNLNYSKNEAIAAWNMRSAQPPTIPAMPPPGCLGQHLTPNPTIPENLDEICEKAVIELCGEPAKHNLKHHPDSYLFQKAIIKQACLAAIAANESKWRRNSIQLAQRLKLLDCNLGGCDSESCKSDKQALSNHAQLLKEEE